MKKQTKIVLTAIMLTAVTLATLPQAFVKANAQEQENTDEIRYGGATGLTVTTQNFTFDEKIVTEDYEIKYGLPTYYAEYGTTVCANTAGAIAIGYYDRFNENLIPNYKTYTKFGSRITYKAQSDTITSLINQLKNLMQGNLEGATFAEFTNGMTTYVRQAGYTYTQQNVMNGSSLNMSKVKTAITETKPVLLFLKNFTLAKTEETSSAFSIENAYGNYTHVTACYGYTEIKYYNNNQLVYTAKLLKIKSGFVETAEYNYLNLSNSNIEEAISTYIC